MYNSLFPTSLCVKLVESALVFTTWVPQYYSSVLSTRRDFRIHPLKRSRVFHVRRAAPPAVVTYLRYCEYSAFRGMNDQPTATAGGELRERRKAFLACCKWQLARFARPSPYAMVRIWPCAVLCPLTWIMDGMEWFDRVRRLDKMQAWGIVPHVVTGCISPTAHAISPRSAPERRNRYLSSNKKHHTCSDHALFKNHASCWEV